MHGTAIELLVNIVLSSDVQLSAQAVAAWERHRLLIVTVVSVLMFVKLGLIIRLLIERKQRLRAQSAVEQQLSYVAHISRVATVGQLAATLAHELRQPLAAIRYNAETARRLITMPNANSVEIKELLDAIASHDERASDVIDRVVSLLRREDRQTECVDLNEVCQGVRRLLQSAAATHRATVELSLEPALPAIMGDVVQLQQVVMNLVLNALEALTTADGPRTVTVTTSSNSHGVELSVRDSGPGVPADIAPHIFEPFYSTKEQGLGMGLVIVRSIVERHGGKIEAQIHFVGGATFRAVLPLVAAGGALSAANGTTVAGSVPTA